MIALSWQVQSLTMTGRTHHNMALTQLGVGKQVESVEKRDELILT
jgi:hypothetical protein